MEHISHKSAVRLLSFSFVIVIVPFFQKLTDGRLMNRQAFLSCVRT